MGQAAAVTELPALEYYLLRSQAQKKIYIHYLDALYPVAKQANFIYLYGDAGVTESGF